MLHCQWYALPGDHRPIVDFVSVELGIEVWEYASDPGKALKRFEYADTVIQQFDRRFANGQRSTAVYLNLRMSPMPAPRSCRAGSVERGSMLQDLD
ncbi:hypothetical protein ACN2XU_21475 [Primorskyibacter sp. 2E107]|uniref:hypothetical protein n=1 Tax=Primorskyibacter sp. 2E107 TaxID=3403458 RepID=UPI003AF69153